MRASALARDTRTLSSEDSGIDFAAASLGKGFHCPETIGGGVVLSIGGADSETNCAGTGSSRDTVGGRPPWLAQPASPVVASRSAAASPRGRDGAFMASSLLRRWWRRVHGSRTGP